LGSESHRHDSPIVDLAFRSLAIGVAENLEALLAIRDNEVSVASMIAMLRTVISQLRATLVEFKPAIAVPGYCTVNAI
jgi:signal transduction histidine kinase